MVVYRFRVSVVWVRFPAPRQFFMKKLIIFDLIGTLARFESKIKESDYINFYRKLGINLKNKDEIKNFIKEFRKLLSFSKSWIDLSNNLLKKFLKKFSKKKIKELAEFYNKNMYFKFFDDVKYILDLPIKKAILTRTGKFLFKELKLEKFFKIFTPRETKFLKPDKRAFIAVLNYHKSKPEETIMVGDEPEIDLIPAKEIGILPILIDRENKIKNYKGIKIDSLKKLKDYVNNN